MKKLSTLHCAIVGMQHLNYQSNKRRDGRVLGPATPCSAQKNLSYISDHFRIILKMLACG